MDLRNYQEEARTTDRVAGQTMQQADLSVIVPLLGLAGEAGGLLSEYKKFLRDGSAHRLFTDRVREELGDILWYVANLATKFDLDLGAVAEENQTKIRDPWEMPAGDSPRLLQNAYVFDAGYPEAERFPRQMDVELRVAQNEGKEV